MRQFNIEDLAELPDLPDGTEVELHGFLFFRTHGAGAPVCYISTESDDPARRVLLDPRSGETLARDDEHIGSTVGGPYHFHAVPCRAYGRALVGPVRFAEERFELHCGEAWHSFRV